MTLRPSVQNLPVDMESRPSPRKRAPRTDTHAEADAAEVEQLLGAGKLSELATLVIETYGPEVLGFLATMLRDRADANDAFAQACEDLWKGLPRFDHRSTIKTWFYTLARNAAFRLRRSPHARRRVSIIGVSEVVARVRSRTALYLRSEVKDGVAAIRDELGEADRALLVLRLDRGMSWTAIARVMAGRGGSAADRKRGAARVRQRFQTIKRKIRDRARTLGLL